jgi:hypothetical protein
MRGIACSNDAPTADRAAALQAIAAAASLGVDVVATTKGFPVPARQAAREQRAALEGRYAGRMAVPLHPALRERQIYVALMAPASRASQLCDAMAQQLAVGSRRIDNALASLDASSYDVQRYAWSMTNVDDIRFAIGLPKPNAAAPPRTAAAAAAPARTIAPVTGNAWSVPLIASRPSPARSREPAAAAADPSPGPVTMAAVRAEIARMRDDMTSHIRDAISAAVRDSLAAVLAPQATPPRAPDDDRATDAAMRSVIAQEVARAIGGMRDALMAQLRDELSQQLRPSALLGTASVSGTATTDNSAPQSPAPPHAPHILIQDTPRATPPPSLHPLSPLMFSRDSPLSGPDIDDDDDLLSMVPSTVRGREREAEQPAANEPQKKKKKSRPVGH